MESNNLADLSLSDEFNNYFAIAVINALNAIRAGNMNEKTFIGKIATLAEDPDQYYFYPYLDQLKAKKDHSGLINLLVNTDDSAHWQLVRPNWEIPMCLSLAERIYLKAILQSRYSAIFFDDEEKAALLKHFQDVPSIGLEAHCAFAGKDTRPQEWPPEEIKNIRLLMSSVRYQREIQYSNAANNGKVYEGCKGYPVRIEYSVFDEKFRLSLWSGDENRPIKINISSMYDIAETGRVWQEPRTPQEMMKTKLAPVPIVMCLRGKEYILERALYSFSMYDTNIEKTGENEYSFRLRYYTFDLPEIIDKLMSFGSAMQVLSPPEAVEKIRERLSAW